MQVVDDLILPSIILEFATRTTRISYLDGNICEKKSRKEISSISKEIHLNSLKRTLFLKA